MTEIMAGATEMPRSCDINVLCWQRSPNTATGVKGLFGAMATPTLLEGRTHGRGPQAAKRGNIHVGFI